MERSTKIRLAKCAAALAVVPVILYAYQSGPDAHRTAVPGTGEGSCSDVGCHIGTSVNGGGGNVKLTASAGDTYTPGQKQTITIQITDSAARAFGFELTARQAGSVTTNAGTFTRGAGQLVLCASVSLLDQGNVRNGASCAANQPLEFVEHSSPFATRTITVDWTAPSSDVGDVTLYVAANAANGNGNETGDHIYTGNLTLHAASVGGGGPKPVITGFVNGATFQDGSEDGSWTTIRGTDLAPNTPNGRIWDSSTEIINGKLPISLDGVSVTVDGKDAFIYYISPTQINIQAPDTGKTGPVVVVVKTSNGSSDAFAGQMKTYSPGLFLFSPQNSRYPAALTSDATFLGPSDLFAGAVVTRPARPGETISLFGTGFGPTNPVVPSGEVFGGAAPTTDAVTVRIGDLDAVVQFAGLSSSGLYQLNVTVPASLADGDYPLVASVGGEQTQANVFVTVKR